MDAMVATATASKPHPSATRSSKVVAQRRQRLLRREARAEGRVGRHSRPQRDGVHRAVGLRQVDVPALHQPHERHHPDRAASPARSPSTARTSTIPRSTSCSCAPASAWCSRSRTRSRSRSTRTSPTVRASTASPQSKAELDEIVTTSLEKAGLFEGGQGPPHRQRHRPFRRPAAAAVHRARHRRQPRGHPDGRAVLGARSDRHRARSRS